MKFLGTLLFTLFLHIAFSQDWNFTSYPVENENQQILKNPFAGGVIAPQVSNLDLNLDSEPDLIIFDRASSRWIPFLKRNNEWIYSPEFNQSLPPVQHWALFRDYDCDGDQDLFTYTTGGAKVWKNESQETNQLSFTLVEDELQSFYDFSTNQFFANITINKEDIPSIADMDGDGDLDILVMSLNDQTIEFHKNFSVEENGGCGLNFKLANRCWGYLKESGNNNTIIIGTNDCDFNVQNPLKSKKHGASSITWLPYDNIKSLLIGDIEFAQMAYVEFEPSSFGGDSAVVSKKTFPNQNAISLPNFPAAFSINTNNQIPHELLAAPNSTSSDAINQQSLWHYTYSNNQWVLQEKNFLQKDMVDAGRQAIPAFADINKDGVEDLIIGNQNSSDGVSMSSELHYLINTGSNEQPNYQLVDSNFCNLKNFSASNTYSPHFHDINNDGELDLIIGNYEGQIYQFLGNGDASDCPFDNVPTQLTLANGSPINIGNRATPFIFKNPFTNKQSLLVGERNGRLSLYEHISNNRWELITNNWGKINVRGNQSVSGNSHPIYSESSGQPEVWVGSNQSRIFRFEILEDPNSSFPIIDTIFYDRHQQTGFQISPALSQLDNSNYRLAIGLESGGLMLFERTITGVTEMSWTKSSSSIYPNPGKHFVEIQTQKNIHSVIIRNNAGQILQTAQVSKLLTSQLANGLYTIEVIFKDGSSEVKIWVKQ